MAGVRQERAAATRRRVVEAADRLFRRDGYLSTTVTAIAAEAGVAVQTLYLSFGSKDAILAAAHDVALVGDDEPVALLNRDWVRRVRHALSAPQALREAVEHLAQAAERVAPVFAVIHAAAADPAVATLLGGLRAQRRESSHAIADLLLGVRGMRGDADRDRVADVLYALVDFATYQVFVVECGWDRPVWIDWMYDVIALEVLPPERPAKPRRRR